MGPGGGKWWAATAHGGGYSRARGALRAEAGRVYQLVGPWRWSGDEEMEGAELSGVVWRASRGGGGSRDGVAPEGVRYSEATVMHARPHLQTSYRSLGRRGDLVCSASAHHITIDLTKRGAANFDGSSREPLLALAVLRSQSSHPLLRCCIPGCLLIVPSHESYETRCHAPPRSPRRSPANEPSHTESRPGARSICFRLTSTAAAGTLSTTSSFCRLPQLHPQHSAMNNTGRLEKGTLPSNMFEMDVVKDALQRRIDAGE